MTTLTFGKHKGTKIENVPIDYLEWGSSKLDSAKWRNTFQTELDRRNSENNKKEVYIKANINSPEVWEILLNEAASDLQDEENYHLDTDCQYDGRVISQEEINTLAEQKLAKYKAEIELAYLDANFIAKWGVKQSQINKLQEAFWDDELEQTCSSQEKYASALELCAKRNKLFDHIYSAICI